MFREKLKTQTKKLHLTPSEDVLNILEREASDLEKQIELLKTVDVTNVRPMVRVDETPTLFLREDNVEEIHSTLSQKDVLENAPLVEGEFIAIRKVAKND